MESKVHSKSSKEKLMSRLSKSELYQFKYSSMISEKQALRDLKQGKIGFKSSVYDTIREKLEEYDNYIENPLEVVEGVTECPRCKSKKVWTEQKQTRGGDESMTTFCTCTDCKNKWTYSG